MNFRLVVGIAGFVVLGIALVGAYYASSSKSDAFTSASTRGNSVVPDLKFVDAKGEPHALDEFRGKVVLLNLWATWCVPCRKEMPALDRLQAKLGGSGFQVLALSIDQQGAPAVRRFFAETGIKSLALYVDPSGDAASRVGAIGVPTSLLLDASGREIARRAGPAEWDASRSVDDLRQRMREGKLQ